MPTYGYDAHYVQQNHLKTPGHHLAPCKPFAVTPNSNSWDKLLEGCEWIFFFYKIDGMRTLLIFDQNGWLENVIWAQGRADVALCQTTMKSLKDDCGRQLPHQIISAEFACYKSPTGGNRFDTMLGMPSRKVSTGNGISLSMMESHNLVFYALSKNIGANVTERTNFEGVEEVEISKDGKESYPESKLLVKMPHYKCHYRDGKKTLKAMIADMKRKECPQYEGVVACPEWPAGHKKNAIQLWGDGKYYADNVGKIKWWQIEMVEILGIKKTHGKAPVAMVRFKGIIYTSIPLTPTMAGRLDVVLEVIKIPKGWCLMIAHHMNRGFFPRWLVCLSVKFDSSLVVIEKSTYSLWNMHWRAYAVAYMTASAAEYTTASLRHSTTGGVLTFDCLQDFKRKWGEGHTRLWSKEFDDYMSPEQQKEADARTKPLTTDMKAFERRNARTLAYYLKKSRLHGPRKFKVLLDSVLYYVLVHNENCKKLNCDVSKQPTDDSEEPSMSSFWQRYYSDGEERSSDEKDEDDIPTIQMRSRLTKLTEHAKQVLAMSCHPLGKCVWGQCSHFSYMQERRHCEQWKLEYYFGSACQGNLCPRCNFHTTLCDCHQHKLWSVDRNRHVQGLFAMPYPVPVMEKEINPAQTIQAVQQDSKAGESSSNVFVGVDDEDMFYAGMEERKADLRTAGNSAEKAEKQKRNKERLAAVWSLTMQIDANFVDAKAATAVAKAAAEASAKAAAADVKAAAKAAVKDAAKDAKAAATQDAKDAKAAAMQDAKDTKAAKRAKPVEWTQDWFDERAEQRAVKAAKRSRFYCKD